MLVLAAALAALPLGVPGAALAADTTPPILSGIHADVTTTSATISWTTDEPADGKLEWGTTTSYASASPSASSLTATHSFTLSIAPTTPPKTFHYRVLSKDAAGNLATSADFTFTPPADTTPPVISNVQAIAGNGPTITWTTDESTDEQVEYGPTASYGASTAISRTMILSHQVGLLGLTPGTLYHYRVLSRDGAGNLTVSGDFTFTATADVAPPTIVNVSVSNVTTTGATIGWTTNEAADAQVEYGTTASYGATSALDATLGTSHGQTLTGLTPGQAGTLYHYRVKSRDAAGNLATSGDLTFTTARDAMVCPCTIFGDPTAPIPSANAGGPIEAGMKFRSSVDGYVTAVRFYKGTVDVGDTGPHTGNLWSRGGQLLASAAFTSETGTGWQTATFGAPVAVAANTTYVASYFAPNGTYWYLSHGSAQGLGQGGPVGSLADGVDGPNGVYHIGGSAFPTDSYRAPLYWNDVVFVTTPPPDTSAPTITARSPAAKATDAGVRAGVRFTFSEPVDAKTIGFELRGAESAVAGSVAYDAASRTATFTPSSPLALGTTYGATVSGAADPAGNVIAADSWSFSTPACPCSLWSDSTTPAVTTLSGGGAFELGLRVRAEVDGSVTGVRFYKGVNNTGAHVGRLWSGSGELLASVTFAGESASGWQTASFASPVAITGGTTYVVSYAAPEGGYAYDSAYFADHGARSGPLLAPGGAGEANGVYAYGTGVFPSSSYNATNYWVDPVFAPAP